MVETQPGAKTSDIVRDTRSKMDILPYLYIFMQVSSRLHDNGEGLPPRSEGLKVHIDGNIGSGGQSQLNTGTNAESRSVEYREQLSSSAACQIGSPPLLGSLKDIRHEFRHSELTRGET